MEKAMAPHSSTLATSCEELTHWKRLWCWEGLEAGGEWDGRGWDGWMVSLTRWTWVWVNSGSWWWTGRSWGCKESDRTEQLNWTGGEWGKCCLSTTWLLGRIPGIRSWYPLGHHLAQHSEFVNLILRGVSFCSGLTSELETNSGRFLGDQRPPHWAECVTAWWLFLLLRPHSFLFHCMSPVFLCFEFL